MASSSVCSCVLDMPGFPAVAASAAASGALKGAGAVSSTAVEQVRKALTGTISGVKVVLREPFKGEEKK